jgi:carbon monoxide dehydrogenase subunit G
MTEIQSESLRIERNSEQVFAFLSDLRNYEKLMPSDDVSDFKATPEKAELSLKGLGHFDITIEEQSPNSRIKLKPTGKLPFKFNIEWLITDNDSYTVVVGQINAELNMFMKMMAEPKLRSFVDKQAHKLKEFLEKEIV